MANTTILTNNLTLNNLDFTQSCDAAADFNRLYFWGSGKEFFLETYRSLINFVITALPRESDIPSECQIMSWFVDLNVREEDREQVLKYMYRKPFDACSEKSCTAITYPGNADIAGVGMLYVYLFEATMTTIYFLTFIFFMKKQHMMLPVRRKRSDLKWRWRVWTWKGKDWSDVAYRLADAIHFTIDDFLDTALVFTFAVIVAGMVMISRSKKTYNMLQSTLVTAFTLSVVIAIWPLRKDTARRQLRRHLSLIVLIALAFAQIRMLSSTKQSTKYVTRRETDCLNEIFPSFRQPSLHFKWPEVFTEISLAGAIVVLPFLIPVPKQVKQWKVTQRISKACSSVAKKAGQWEITQMIGHAWSFVAREVAQWKMTRMVIRVWWLWRVIVSFYGVVCMWGSLISLLYIRGLVDRKIGVSYSERSWGFGQVLALTTWLPMQEMLLDIFLRGPQNALQERVPAPWTVSHKGSHYHLIEIDRHEEVGEECEEVPLRGRRTPCS